MSDPIFGISIASADATSLPAIVANMSVIGLVGTAPAADVTAFPLDTPVAIYSDDSAMLTLLGTTGTLPDAIAAINNQIGEFEVAAQIVIVRVTAGSDAKSTIANLVGSVNSRTGLYALLNAPNITNLTPRLIAVPGYTSQAVNQVSATVSNLVGGTGYTAAPTISFTGGGSDPAKVLPTAHATVSGGIVTGIVFDTLGANLTAAPTIVFTPTSGGTGASATAVLDTSSNAVVAALPTVLDQLLAHAVVDGPCSTDIAAQNWRASISSKRIIPVDQSVKILDSTGTVRTVPASPYILGLLVKRDHEFQGRPFHSVANQTINGIVGVGRPIEFSILDGSTQGQVLLGADIGIIVRGNYTDGSPADGGYVYIGTNNCSPDTLWQFYNQTRGRDYIHLAFIKTLRAYLGKFNLTGQTIQAVVNTMDTILRDLQAENDILGYKVGFTRSANSASNLRLGKFFLQFEAEEPAPLTYIGIKSSRYLPALDTLLSDLLQQLDLTA